MRLTLRTPSSSISRVVRTRIWDSVTASIFAWALRWGGWRHKSRSACCWNGLPTSDEPAANPGALGGACTFWDQSSCRSGSKRDSPLQGLVGERRKLLGSHPGSIMPYVLADVVSEAE